MTYYTISANATNKNAYMHVHSEHVGQGCNNQNTLEQGSDQELSWSQLLTTALKSLVSNLSNSMQGKVSIR